MAIDADKKILQDFLTEAGEILETLGEQLVELERCPDDYDLLNAVFRGFHTIKGGAGFLNLTSLVEICHRAEDVFNTLRQGERQVDAALMDVVLRALDSVNAIFQALRADTQVPAAEADLLRQLEIYTRPAGAAKPDAVSPPTGTQPVDLVDQEFETLLAAAAKPAAAAPATAAGQAEITDEEFEALLDAMQGVPTKNPGPKSVAATGTPAKPTSPATPKAAAASASQQEITVRVDTKRLDDLMNMVGELVLVRNRLVTLDAALRDEEMAKAVGNIDMVTANLQLAVMKTRMQPIKKVFGRFPRLVRDLARSLNKEVELEMRGEDTDLDKNMVEALADPLIHLVRNAVDHGIETPDKRLAAGKPAVGRLILAAEQAGDHIRLIITDDGAGMDVEALRNKAVEKGLLDEESAARLSREDCYNLIFLPGFSTKTEISDISGRGVGMDVVKTNVTQLNGVIDIESALGQGTCLTIKVPLTLAILPTLMVKVNTRALALPLTAVGEILHMDLSHAKTLDGQQVLLVRDKPLPIFYLRHWLQMQQAHTGLTTLAHVVVVQVGMQRIGLVVDELLGQEEVVIKPLGALLQGIPGLAGATITGDGCMALVLDMPGLLKSLVEKSRTSTREVA